MSPIARQPATMRVWRASTGLTLLFGLAAACESSPKHGSATHSVSATAAKEKTASPGPPPRSAVHLPSGLATQVLRSGHGQRTPDEHDAVRVHFTGWNEKGKRFEDTRAGGKPKVFSVSGVIAGWSEALKLMKVGEQRRVWVPDKLGYPGRPGYPRGQSVFDIELLEIVQSPEPAPAPADVAAPPPDAKRTEGGVAFRYLERGKGQHKPRSWDRVTLDYTGWTADGEPFDSSSKLGRPAAFDVDDVIPGWAEALARMTVGVRMRIWVPAALAYQGRHDRPQGPVVFDLALRSIERRAEPPRLPATLHTPPKRADRTPSGLAYLPLATGRGERHPSATSRVEVHYSAFTSDGKLFDSSVVRGHPVTVPLARMIPGWAEGLQRMVEGDRYLLWIPEKLAYAGEPGGPRGALVYEVELRKIRP